MKILLVDDHRLFRDALVQYIRRAEPDTDIALSHDVSDMRARLEEEDDFDVVLMDLRMPGMEGMTTLQAIIQEYPHLRFALISGTAENRDVMKASQYGAVGYFPKTLSGKELMSGVRDIVDGKLFFPKNGSDKAHYMPAYFDDKRDKSKSSKPFTLTPREDEVLRFLLTGATNGEIADALDLQLVTVKLHVRGVCRKLKARNRTEAVIVAKEHGY